jgi:lipid A 3-O-deacylase
MFGFAFTTARPLNRAAKMKRLLVTLLLLTAAVRGGVAAEATFDHGPVFTVLEENDLFVKTDRHYTQGIKLSYLHSDNFLPLGSRILYDSLPHLGLKPEVGRFGYSIGQNIYTPADITNRMLLRDDRPYAGWLYVGAILQRRGWMFEDRLTEDDVELELGVIGSWSLGREAQTWVHEIRNFDLPRGWKYQIKNEPGIRLKMSRAVRLFEREGNGFGFDITARVGTSLGNIDTSLRAGPVLRAGYNLPDDFGYHTIDSVATTSGGRSKSKPSRWNAYVFAAAEGRVVFYNETLDGDLFHDSHSVQREWLVGDTLIGFAVGFEWLEFGYAHTFRSPEYRGQDEHDSFGSVFLKARF